MNSQRLDKRRRKEMLDKWRADQRAAARGKLPLPNEQMQALFDMLSVELPRAGGDKTLRLVRQWLKQQDLPIERVEAWLHANGGHCDCEALASAEQCWLDAIDDANW